MTVHTADPSDARRARRRLVRELDRSGVGATCCAAFERVPRHLFLPRFWVPDAEQGWEQMAPFFLHETNAYGAWQAQDDIASPYRTVDDIDELRARGQYCVLTPDEFVTELEAAPFPFHGPFVCGTIRCDTIRWVG